MEFTKKVHIFKLIKMRKELTEAFNSWYVIDGNEHLKMGSLKDAIELMGIRAQAYKGHQLLMMSDKEYATWHSRKIIRKTTI